MPTISRTVIKARFSFKEVGEKLQAMGLKSGQIVEDKDIKRIAFAVFEAGMNVQLEHFPTGDIIWVEMCRFIPNPAQ